MKGARTVLLTGASSGIGLETARLLLRTPHRLLLTARESSLPRFAAAGIEESGRVRLRALDVTDEPQRRAIVAEAETDWGGVDILINNAGVTYRAVVEHVKREERLAQMGINFRAPMQLVRLVLPSMRRKREGRIISVSSVGGMMAMPTMAAYSASKWALEGAHEALWYEVRPWSVHVSLVQPGFVHSRAFQRVHYTVESDRSERRNEEPYHEHYASMSPFVAKLMNRSPATSRSVARVIVRTMRRRRPPLRVPATPDAWLFAGLRRVLPRGMYHWLLYRSLPNVKAWGGDAPEPDSEPDAE